MPEQASIARPERRRAFRHPKQRFDPEAEFVWRKRLLVGGRYVEPGEPVDRAALAEGDLHRAKGKLRRLWRVNAIELKGWAPSVKAKPVPERSVMLLSLAGRGRYTLKLAELERQTTADGEGGRTVFEVSRCHRYRCHGLGNLLERADGLRVRGRVEKLLGWMKERDATSVCELEPERLPEFGLAFDAEACELRARTAEDDQQEPDESAPEPTSESTGAGQTEGGEGAPGPLEEPQEPGAGEGEPSAPDGGGAAEVSGAPADSPPPAPPLEPSTGDPVPPAPSTGDPALPLEPSTGDPVPPAPSTGDPVPPAPSTGDARPPAPPAPPAPPPVPPPAPRAGELPPPPPPAR